MRLQSRGRDDYKWKDLFSSSRVIVETANRTMRHNYGKKRKGSPILVDVPQKTLSIRLDSDAFDDRTQPRRVYFKNIAELDKVIASLQKHREKAVEYNKAKLEEGRKEYDEKLRAAKKEAAEKKAKAEAAQRKVEEEEFAALAKKLGYNVVKKDEEAESPVTSS